MNETEIFSRRDYNKYEIAYPVDFPSPVVKKHILVETVFMVKSYPDEFKSAASLIYDFWKEIGDTKAIEQYEMQPFNIRVQTLQRTLIDKVFAICNHAISGRIEGYSRHIYDLSRLLTVVELNDELKKFVREIRYARKENERYLIEQGDENIPNILRDIIDKEIYREDYKSITRGVLYDNTSYDEAIKALSVIIESGVFEFDDGAVKGNKKCSEM